MKRSNFVNPVVLGATCLGVCFTGAVLPAFANPAYDEVRGHEEIIVTATRTPVALADSLASVSVITREQLDARQPLDLVDVFSQTASLDISRSGGPGSATSLYTRGTANGHTLILVDGQRVSSATLGSANFQFLNPDQIERIEVVRGAHSSLYGSEAIGGVIQIFTRDGSSNPGSYVTTAAGSNSLHKVAAGTSGSTGNLRYGVHATYLETDGIDNLIVDTGYNRDKDGYRNKSINTSLGYRFDNGADLALRFLESNNRNEYDSAFGPKTRPYSDSLLQNINLRGRLPVTDFWETQLSLGLATDDSDNYDGAIDRHNARHNTGNFRTQRQQLFWQNDFTIAEDHIITAGYDYFEDEVNASSAYVDSSGEPVKARDNNAAFAQYQGSWSVVDLVLGLREEDNEEFGSHTTGNASLGFHLDAHHLLVATWAEGFKAPTFNDLYWPASAFSAGNPNLQPELSENRELSLRGNYDRWHWSLGYFENDVENLIEWAPGPDFVWRPYNVSEAEINGAELAAGTTLAGWSLEAAYTWLDPRDANTDNLLVKRTRSNITLNADKTWGDLNFGLAVKGQDKRYTNTSNSQWLGGYTTVALHLGYQITPALEGNIKVDNLFDKGYHLNRGYNQDGRTWQLGLTYRL